MSDIEDFSYNRLPPPRANSIARLGRRRGRRGRGTTPAQISLDPPEEFQLFDSIFPKTRGKYALKPGEKAILNSYLASLYIPEPHHIPLILSENSFLVGKNKNCKVQTINPSIINCVVYDDFNDISHSFNVTYWWFELECNICLNVNAETLFFTCGHHVCHNCFQEIGEKSIDGVAPSVIPLGIRKACIMCRCIFKGFSFVDKTPPLILHPDTKTYIHPFTHVFNMKDCVVAITTVTANQVPSFLIFKSFEHWELVNRVKQSFMSSHGITSLTLLHINNNEGNLYLFESNNNLIPQKK